MGRDLPSCIERGLHFAEHTGDGYQQHERAKDSGQNTGCFIARLGKHCLDKFATLFSKNSINAGYRVLVTSVVPAALVNAENRTRALMNKEKLRRSYPVTGAETAPQLPFTEQSQNGKQSDKREIPRLDNHENEFYEDGLERLAFASPTDVADRPRHEPPFDLVIVDEASRMSAAELLLVATKGKQIVVIGDSRQLGAPACRIDAYAHVLSLGLPHLPLSSHYRSKHPDLIRWSNRFLYDDALRTVPSRQTLHSRGATNNSVVRHGVSLTLCTDPAIDRTRDGIINHDEASLVAKRLAAHARAITAGEDTRSVLAIGATTAQAKAIRAATAAEFERQNIDANVMNNSAEPTAYVVDGATGRTASMSFTSTVPSSFMRVVGMRNITVNGSSKAAAPFPPFIDFYLLLDNTPSMGVGATPTDIATMINNTPDQCAFACHDISAGSSDYYSLVKRLGIISHSRFRSGS